MLSRLRDIQDLRVSTNVPLSGLTRFGVGGDAAVLADATTEAALVESVRATRASGVPFTVIGGGTNLVASDEGFPGVVLRYVAPAIEPVSADRHSALVRASAGAVLQDLVDFSIARGLRGLATMTGIPGWVGGAVYGNAGAYGHSIDERVISVRFFDGVSVREIDRAGCGFRYRESAFKHNKSWIILSVLLELTPADASDLKSGAESILAIRNEKYPPSMRCAGSIFKNLIFADLPAAVQSRVPSRVVREGKVPSAYFLELAGAKGIVRGGVRVADYHANLIYNTGAGTAREIRGLIADLKQRVQSMFGIELEEEVQFI
jgi:UDP-N-acetylmuramate dehydrogenase